VSLEHCSGCMGCFTCRLQGSMPTGTRIVTCRLTTAGAESWVDFKDNQSTLTAARSWRACRGIPHDIQCRLRSQQWVRGLPGPDFEDHPSVVSRSALTETSMLPPCCAVILEHCSGCMGCFTCRLQGCLPYVESTTCFKLQENEGCRVSGHSGNYTAVWLWDLDTLPMISSTVHLCCLHKIAGIKW